jgi:BMFP domain-containing protein YqiC
VAADIAAEVADLERVAAGGETLTRDLDTARQELGRALRTIYATRDRQAAILHHIGELETQTARCQRAAQRAAELRAKHPEAFLS